MGSLLLAGIVCAVIAAAITYFALRAQSAGLDARLSGAERELAAARQELAAKNSANAQLDRELAGLRVSLANEQKNSADKIALLQNASADLQKQFENLAASALKSNNESFLQLARTQLEVFQNQAKGDLTERQKAIETLVKPIHESLSK